MLPILFDSNYFTLYAYPLFMGLAWGVSYYLSRYFFESNNLPTAKLTSLFLGVFVASWLGAKVFFLVFSDIQLAKNYLTANEFWLGGGFVFYGGLVFGLIYFLIYSGLLKKFPLKEAYLFVPGIAFGHALGRVGCFFTGCCYGTQCDLPWSVHMHGSDLHPVQLYEAGGLFVLGIIVIAMMRKKSSSFNIICFYLFSYSVLRFILEYFRGDKVRGIYWFELSTSQITSLVLISLIILIFGYQKSKKTIQ